jgi:hypothetical protein
MTLEEIIEKITQEIKSLSTHLTADDYENAVYETLREAGWTLPTDEDFKIVWVKTRSKRHLFFYLMTESAHKFKFEQANLQHRFEHYSKIIEQMDMAWTQIIEERPEMFPNQGLLAGGVEAYEIFGTQASAGFAYDIIGRDTTYTDFNQVQLNPNENS